MTRLLLRFKDASVLGCVCVVGGYPIRNWLLTEILPTTDGTRLTAKAG